MEPNPQRIDKTERVRIRPDADERKAARQQEALDRGMSPDEALAHAEESVARELAQDESTAADDLGESMGEEFVDAAVHGEAREDQRAEPSPAALRGVDAEVAAVSEMEPLPTPDDPTRPTPEEPTPDAPLPQEPAPRVPTKPVV